ncbi:amino acid/polyamine transporter I [Thelonectria olida]|uniref:Amino acid/polyamine transporter I n=1 Tax=Thelonectria olida TaxID=1576542 RepID=A0A9P8WFD5_9HYPO|nr:amino acid/polyamine transporter I [Thelonectria olida]
MLVFAQCAARFATAGGAYHYAVFLLPDKYRRQCAYPLGWLNYFGWVLTHAACCAVTATLALALINLCDADFDVTVRWRLFIAYLIVAVVCWAVNLFGLRGIPTLEIIGCWVTVIGFVGFSIALLAKAPKASTRFVFVETNNDTGYSSTGLAVLLGLMNSFSTLMGLDSPTHLGEELPQPKRILPRILIVVIVSQFVIGIIWILVLGFSIRDLSAIVATSTGVPVLEIIRLALDSRAAAIVFCSVLLINMAASSLGSGITMSRQGYAFARDSGLFWNDWLTKLSPGTNLPTWSIHLSSGLVVLIGLIYLFSLTAFNAIIGAQAVCQIVSFGFPALVLLLTRGSSLPPSRRWNFGVWGDLVYMVTVVYVVLVVIVAFIPQTHPVRAETMNYTVLIMGCLAVAMTAAWFLEGKTKFSPPVNAEAEVDVEIIDGIEGGVESTIEEPDKKDTTASVTRSA